MIPIEWIMFMASSDENLAASEISEANEEGMRIKSNQGVR